MGKSMVLLMGVTLLVGTAFAENANDPTKDLCSVQSITAVNLAEGAVLHVGDASLNVPLTFAALTDCPADTASVSFALDAGPSSVTTAGNAGGLFSIAGPALSTLAPGAHTLTVQAASTSNPEAVVGPVAIHFSVVHETAAADANVNGIPDDSFAALTATGDTWLASTPVADTGANRLTGICRWNGQTAAAGAAVVALSDAVNPALRVSVIAPKQLLNASETGLLLVQMAPDLLTLLGAIESEVVGPDPALLIENGLYVEASIVVSSDGGAHFTEIDPARLAAHPVHLAIEGASVAAAEHPALYAYPTSLVTDPVVGDRVIAWSGEWNQEDIVRTTTMPSSIEADLAALSVFAPVDEAENAPVIDVVLPSEGEPYSFGLLAVGQHLDAAFTVRNLGGGTLAGKATVPAPFTIVEGATYRLASGQSQTVKVRFTPPAATQYEAYVSFSGAGGAGVAVKGTGFDADTSSSCNASQGILAATPPPPGGDGLLLAACAVALMAGGRRLALRGRRS